MCMRVHFQSLKGSKVAKQITSSAVEALCKGPRMLGIEASWAAIVGQDAANMRNS